MLWWSKNARQYRQDNELDYDPAKKMSKGNIIEGMELLLRKNQAHREKSANANVYLQMLHRCLLPIVDKIHDTIGDPLFQQDNASIHKPCYGVLREPYQPSYSPLISTRQSHRARVGSVEATTSFRLPRYQRYPKRAEVKARLAQALLRVWDNKMAQVWKRRWRKSS